MLQYSVPGYTETIMWADEPINRRDVQCISSGLAALKNIEQAEVAMLSQPQVECPVIHRFGPGVYIREVMIPAGSIAIGHHQNFEHMNIMLKGRVTILNDDGSTGELAAPLMFTGKPGRKIGYIHEDMVWLNVYPTTETDVEKLEAHYLTKSDAWLESAAANESIKQLKSNVDALDYQEVLNELGITEETVRAQSENASDMTDLPFGGYKIKVARSHIEGQGLFATADIVEGETIAPARINGMRTIAGRYTNHSANPNARMSLGRNSEIDLVAIKPINGCRGGQDGQEITIDYRDALRVNLLLSRSES